MTEILLGPTLTDGPTTKVKDKTTGKTYYKKQILREGIFDYKLPDGEKIKLDLSAGNLKKYVEAFKEKAYDEVPFQFGHTNDHDKRGGTLAHVEHIPGKGVEGYFELDSKAEEYVKTYPNFGVSPRLILDVERADGKKFEGAIQHVAGTVVPRLNGMSPWQKVELSEGGDTDSSTPVIDLSTETIAIEREGKLVPEQKTEEGEKKVFTLSEEDYNFFKTMKKEYEEIMAQEKKETPAPAAVELSEEVKAEIAAAKTAASDALAGLAAIKAQAVKSEWGAKRALLLSQGVPPAALDLADPIMTSPEPQVYDLSTPDGEKKVDAKTVMLSQLELMRGTIDFSESGHGVRGIEGAGDDPAQLQAWADEFLQ